MSVDVHDIIDHFQNAESETIGSEFIAPVLPGRQVQIRISGVVCKLRIVGRFQVGWRILRVVSMQEARIVKPASKTQIQQYLKLLPKVHVLMVLAENDGDWLAIKQKGDSRFIVEGMLRIKYATSIQPFSWTISRFDGQTFFYHDLDRRSNLSNSAFLRDSLLKETPPETLRRSGIMPEEREAYKLIFDAVMESKRNPVEVRLEEALEVGGGKLTSFIEHSDRYSVTFDVEGHPHTSHVSKNDLTVLTSGICLADKDQEFDLQSLVGVFREYHHEDYY